jgi:LacI family transcriptional regulator
MADLKRIGVRMELDKPFKRHVAVFGGIREYAERHPDWQLIVDEWVDHSLPSRRGRSIPYDGVIGRLTPLAAERARRLDLPAVNIWLSSPAKGLPGVFPDLAASGKLVAEHLLNRGFRYLAALLQNDDKGTALQAASMQAFAEEAGFDGWLGTVSLDEPNTHDQWRHGLETINRWMDSWKMPLGLLARDPGWARAIVEMAKTRGWNVPEQIAIVCTHNDEIHCEYPEPGMTAVEFAEQQQGYDAASMLDGLIEAKRHGVSPFADPQTVFLPPVGLVARHSTDFFAVSDPFVGQALRYIAAHLHKPLGVPQVARVMGVARRTLDAWFEKSLGLTVADEINRLRIERVKRELMASSDPIEAIARRTGFASVRTLRHQFQQTVGMSPTVFRSHGVVSASSRPPSKRHPP